MYAPDLPRQRRQLVRLNHKARQFTQRTWHTPYNMSNSAARHHNHSLLRPSLGLLTTHSYIYHTTAHSLQRRSPGLSYNHSLPQLYSRWRSTSLGLSYNRSTHYRDRHWDYHTTTLYCDFQSRWRSTSLCSQHLLLGWAKSTNREQAK